MACRDAGRCEAAKAELDARQLPGSCRCSCLDVGDYQSIRSFAARMRKDPDVQEQKIKVLVNNAGTLSAPPGGTV
jgi:NAD(P)-dependent dehydrogenase (short-subunit alcohol dehydrogenase family)